MDNMTTQAHAHKEVAAAHKHAHSANGKAVAGSERVDPRERLIVALDFPSADEAMELVERLEGAAAGSRWGWSCTTRLGTG